MSIHKRKVTITKVLLTLKLQTNKFSKIFKGNIKLHTLKLQPTTKNRLKGRTSKSYKEQEWKQSSSKTKTSHKITSNKNIIRTKEVGDITKEKK